MKKLFTLFTITFIFIFSQKNAVAQSCCKKPTEMQTLAMNASFHHAHAAPLPLNYTPQKGKMISIPTAGGKDGSAFFIPSDVPSDKVLLVFQEWWGLNDYIKREAEKWHQLLGGKVNVYAPDLYDGQVAEDAQTAGKLMAGLTQERGEAIVRGTLAKAGKDKKVATIGWCMGGSWSFTASVMAGKRAQGCVMYYGFPEKEADRIKPLKCDVLYMYGNKDEHIKMEHIEAFKKQVKATGNDITVFIYPAVHAFANPSNPNYDVGSAALAQDESLKFLKKKLQVD
jgi:carboxymethylenebutenolidase